MQNPLHRVVGILGFGVDGKCVAEFLLRQKEVEEVRMFDDARHRPERVPRQRDESKGDKMRWGTTLDGVSLLFRSPGFKLTHPLVLEAKKRGVPITSSTTYFLQRFPRSPKGSPLGRGPLGAGVTVGITGSNGKTTCTALIAEMLRAEFGKERVEEGGNDRKPRLDLLNPQSPIPNPQSISNAQFSIPNYVVLELSSFQLIDCPVSPHIAVVLNVTPNHLDWHADMQEYTEAKRQIIAHQKEGDIAVLNPRDTTVKNFERGLKSTVRWFDDPSTFNFPAFAKPTSPRLRGPGASAGRQLSTFNFRTHPDTIRAAATAARALGVSDVNIAKVLTTFAGVPHRLELVRELDGVKWYNDSSCTTPESAVVACEAFPAGSVILLLGGRDKGMDFSKLYEVIGKQKVRVVPYGEMAETFEANVTKNYKLKTRNSFEEAIATARDIAKKGDNIVLSPACASFDMFPNAKERGRKFVEIVRRL